jgi:mxaL protein
VHGLLVGVGGNTLVPIPKFGVDGKPLGYWEADEVLQTDVYSRGRGGSVAGETMVDQETQQAEGRAPAASEHLSSLKETHLQQLASELGLGYYRLESAAGLVSALERADLAQETSAPFDLRGVLGGATLAALALMFLLRPRRVGAL